MSFIGRFLVRNTPLVLKNVQGQPRFARSFVNTAPLASAKVREPAPSFQGVAVVNKDFKNISLADYKGKYLLLFFYPMDFTFVCPTEIWSFSDRLKEFQDLQADVVGVSVDSQFSHLAWINTDRKEGGLGDIKYPLLADITKSVSSDYGVLLEKDGISLRGTFIIDGAGILRHMSINDLPVGRSVDEYIRLIKAFQYADKHGEVCPANWHPEKNPDTMIPDVDKSKKYFSKK